MTEVNKVNVSRGGGMGEDGGGGGGKLIKMIVMAVVALLVLGGGGFAVWKFVLSTPEEGGKETAGGGSASVVEPGAERIEKPVFLPMGTFIVNLADGRRYLKTNLELMLSEEKAKVYLSDRLAEVKDFIVSELQTLSTEQLRDPKERVELKERLKKKIETLIPVKDKDWDDPRPLKKVLITEFYLQ